MVFRILVCKVTGFSIPQNLITIIDEQRGDVTRSKYVTRMIEHSLSCKNEKSVQGNGFEPNPCTEVVSTGPTDTDHEVAEDGTRLIYSLQHSGDHNRG